MGAEPDEDAVTAAAAGPRRAAPLERAALAAASCGGSSRPGGDLLGMPSAPCSRHARRCSVDFSGAHRGPGVAGSEPDEWAIERDLEDALELLLRDHADPPDPAALVGERHRQVRRRSLVVAGTATLAVGTAASWGVDAVPAARHPRPRHSHRAPVTPLAHDEHLARAREPANRPGGAGRRPRPGPHPGHLLFADDLPGQRVVVAAAFGRQRRLGHRAPVDRPARRSLRHPAADRPGPRPDHVPRPTSCRSSCRLPDRDRSPGPAAAGAAHVLTAEYSTRVTYASTGEAMRTWTEVPLAPGPRGSPSPGRCRRAAGQARGLRRWAGGDVTAGPGRPDPTGPVAASLLEAVGPFVSAVTGPARHRLRSRVVLEAAGAGDVSCPRVTVRRLRGLAAVVVTHLPGGARLRTVRVAGDGRGEVGPGDLETARGDPRRRRRAPFAVRLPGFTLDVRRFLVLAPGAARAQLVAATASNVYPASPVTALSGGTGVLEVVNARLAAVVPARHLEPTGRRLGGWRQVFRRARPARPLATGALRVPERRSAALVRHRGGRGGGGLRVEVLARAGRHEVVVRAGRRAACRWGC